MAVNLRISLHDTIFGLLLSDPVDEKDALQDRKEGIFSFSNFSLFFFLIQLFLRVRIFIPPTFFFFLGRGRRTKKAYICKWQVKFKCVWPVAIRERSWCMCRNFHPGKISGPSVVILMRLLCNSILNATPHPSTALHHKSRCGWRLSRAMAFF